MFQQNSNSALPNNILYLDFTDKESKKVNSRNNLDTSELDGLLKRLTRTQTQLSLDDPNQTRSEKSVKSVEKVCLSDSDLVLVVLRNNFNDRN